MDYHLYPPFLVIEPHAEFATAWENFCRLLLNLEHKTSEIRRRTPPDLGADLIWDNQGVLYQCKAAKNGQAGALNMSEVTASIQRACAQQDTLYWRRYVLCTNVDITGKQEQTLRALLPAIELRTQGYWTDLCHKFPAQIAQHFRQLIPVAPNHLARASQKAYLRTYLQQFQDYAQMSPMNLHVYLQQYERIFELPVSPDFSAEDVLLILRELLELPGPRVYQDLDVRVSLRYSLCINDNEIPPHTKMRDLTGSDQPLITIWKLMQWQDRAGQTESLTMESTFPAMQPAPNTSRTSHILSELALQRYNQTLASAIHNAIAVMTRENNP